ncbi:hypothetical protein [Thalassospira sp.]|uniref:hypothetical protein n=1 Tax=Thalassospira sp. TaxID=1912094 RepID=UPI001B205ED8|nr:hypothetical protein [Thalassospira sp.]MBO6806645.1 hypothetical protein [Thalassospira sp.]MBO6840268.1 hypothetical protein [Thalassospira sp.]
MACARQIDRENGGVNWLCIALSVIILFCFGIKTSSADHGKHNLRILVADDVLVDYKRFVDGRDPLEIEVFDGKHSRRDVVEVVLLQQALRRGGWLGAFELLPGGNYARMMHMLANGEADITGSSTWLRDIEHKADRIASSTALIPEGRFEAGFYMLADNPNRLKVKNLRGIRLLRAASNRHWIPDWQALAKLHPVDLIHVPSWELMVQFVAEGRADFLLAPFQPGPEMELVVNGNRLLPIPDYKIALDGSRHFAVTRATPYSQDLLVALDQGIVELERIGRIEQAYRESGFFHPDVTDWNMIGSDGFGQSHLMPDHLADDPDNSMQNQIFSLSDITSRLYPETTDF